MLPDPIMPDDATVSASDETVDWITGIREQDDVVVLEASIRHTKLDCEAVYIPVTTIIGRDGETVTASRIYGDMAPLYDVDPDEAPLIC